MKNIKLERNVRASQAVDLKVVPIREVKDTLIGIPPSTEDAASEIAEQLILRLSEMQTREDAEGLVDEMLLEPLYEIYTKTEINKIRRRSLKLFMKDMEKLLVVDSIELEIYLDLNSQADLEQLMFSVGFDEVRLFNTVTNGLMEMGQGLVIAQDEDSLYTAMAETLVTYRSPSYLELVSIMDRDDFFRYLSQDQIGYKKVTQGIYIIMPL